MISEADLMELSFPDAPRMATEVPGPRVAALMAESAKYEAFTRGGAGFPVILEAGKGATGGESGLQITIDAQGAVNARTTTADWFETPNGAIADTAGHHVVLTKNGASRTCYVDGISQSNAAANQTLANSTDDLFIGRTAGSSVNALDGWADEFAIYRGVVLSSGQAAAHFAAGAGAVGALPFRRPSQAAHTIGPSVGWT